MKLHSLSALTPGRTGYEMTLFICTPRSKQIKIMLGSVRGEFFFIETVSVQFIIET